MKVGGCVSHFNASLIVWAQSQDSVHKPEYLKRKESRSGSNRGPSAYQPSALPLGHTGSRLQGFVLVSYTICGLTRSLIVSRHYRHAVAVFLNRVGVLSLIDVL